MQDAGMTNVAFQTFHSVFILVVLFVCSLMCVAFIVERWLYYKKISINPEKTLLKIRNSLIAGRLEEALEILGDVENNPILSVVQVGIRNGKLAKEQVSEIMRACMIKQKMRLEKYLGVLGTLGNTAPFIGLLGTVMGIIQAFRDLAGPQAQANGATVVATGIAEALVATAAGLFVAIPAVVFYNYFLKKVKNFMSEMEVTAMEVLVMLSMGRNNAS